MTGHSLPAWLGALDFASSESISKISHHTPKYYLSVVLAYVGEQARGLGRGDVS